MRDLNTINPDRGRGGSKIPKIWLTSFVHGPLSYEDVIFLVRLRPPTFPVRPFFRPSVYLSSKAADFFPPRPIFTLQKELLRRRSLARWLARCDGEKRGKIEPGILGELGRSLKGGKAPPSSLFRLRFLGYLKNSLVFFFNRSLLSLSVSLVNLFCRILF